jgi:hypothetical protein
MWVYLNWALGFRSLGCDIILLERVISGWSMERLALRICALRERLAPYGLDDSFVLYTDEIAEGASPEPYWLDYDVPQRTDLLVNLRYSLAEAIVTRFKHTALVDIDPGLLQYWIAGGQVSPATHDMYFTTGETVGAPGSSIPTAGINWQHTVPCVSLDWWPVHLSPPDAPFTTVSHWFADEWMQDDGEIYPNDKRTGFLPFLDLPGLTDQKLELALCFGDDEIPERRMLEKHGWHVRKSTDVSSSPRDYQDYIGNSRGEFSCVKPSCIRMRNAWISDRTICYLASGHPAIVQHTGPSRFLPDGQGLFRFQTIEEAAKQLDTVAGDYPNQCQQARLLAEEYFDAHKVLASLLERAIS